MSLNHILQSAQKLGMPVVITDRRGTSPQVILPFDDFMALVNSTPQKRGFASGSVDELDEMDLDAMDMDFDETEESADWDLSAFDAQDTEASGEDPFQFTVEAPGSSDEVNPVTTEPLGESQAPEGLGNGMDERFYLEPLDEVDTLK